MKTLNISKYLIALVIMCLAPGCMSMYDVTSDPQGAQIYLDGQPIGTTPDRVTFPIGQTKTVTLKKEGYETFTGVLRNTGGAVRSAHFTMTKESSAPVSFVKMIEPTWASVEIREGVAYEQAWKTIVDLLVRKFDMAVLSKENGYMRTAWLFSWTGELREDYRVRVTIKFSPDHKKVDVKSEANYKHKTGWLMGSDTALLKTLKTDLMGTVGRTTR
ncbi:PEGA domain-containing protein [Planctomycetota bacterium]